FAAANGSIAWRANAKPSFFPSRPAKRRWSAAAARSRIYVPPRRARTWKWCRAWSGHFGTPTTRIARCSTKPPASPPNWESIWRAKRPAAALTEISPARWAFPRWTDWARAVTFSIHCRSTSWWKAWRSGAGFWPGCSPALTDLSILPALRADQRHKTHAAQIVFLECLFCRSRDADQTLLISATHGHDQPAADFQLLPERFGQSRHAGRDQDGIERRLFGPADAAISRFEGNVAILQCP